MSLEFKDNIGLAHLMAGKFHSQLKALGFEYDDVFQEFAIVMMKSLESFEEERGFAFSTFFAKCCYSHYVKLVKKNARHYDCVAIDLDVREDSSIDVERDLIHRETIESFVDNLSKSAKYIVKETMKTSALIDDELKKINGKGATVTRLRCCYLLMTRSSRMSVRSCVSLWQELAPLEEIVN